MTINLLKSKDKVFRIFQRFQVMVEREIEMLYKCLCTNNGGEHTSNQFRSYWLKHGIRYEKLVPHIPQHNGKENETVLTTYYLINMYPSIPLNFDLPEKIWRGKEASYSHLKAFGYKAFALVPKE